MVVETPRNRTVLAILLARANDLVGVEQLVDELWPQHPPGQARALVRGYVSRIRGALRDSPAADRLITRKPGYLMRVEDGELDVHRFEALVGGARIARQAGRFGECVTLFRQAHLLWRGTPFADLPATSIIAAAATRLAELRLASLEELYDTVLTSGRDAGMVTELTDLVAEHPFRERFVGQLMLVLHRGGRTADALTAYQEVQRRLADEFGIDPGTELQQLRLAILRNDRGLAADPATDPVSPPSSRLRPDDVMAYEVPVPRQLPGDLSTFTGRDVELARLLTWAGPKAGNADNADTAGVSAAPVILTIEGMPGVGKTALAVHAAHRLADRCPDGQLFVDLHGFTQGVTPLDPADALDRMLRGMGVPGEQIPHDLDARAALYRTRLAGRRMLIVLDNAVSESQVSPLLPGSPGCVVLITSRRRLTGIDDAHSVSLGVLPLEDALGLFAHITGEDHTSPTLAEIVELCGRLPLAIRIAAARLNARPSWTAADLADRLRGHRHRLSELALRPRSVTAAVDLSYRQLNAAQRRMFRLLSLHPGADIDAYAAAALADTTVRNATQLLDDLTDAHLQHEPTPGRFRFHDLLRAHAAHAATDEDTETDRRAALTRLFDHYTHTASAATDIVHPHLAAYLPPIPRPATPAPAFAEQTNEPANEQAAGLTDRRAGAAAWLEAELVNLLAVASHAADRGRPAHTLQLSATLRRHLHHRGRYTQVVGLVTRALDAARALGHPVGELDALCGLGEVHKYQGRFGPAADCFDQALRIARRIGHQLGEYDALRGLGYLHRYQGRFGPAAGCFDQALRIARDIDSDVCELTALYSLGHLHRYQGRFGPAAGCFDQALRIARRIGDRESEMIALHGLGVTRRAQGRYGPATDCLKQALNLARETGDHNYQFEALHNLGHTRRATGQSAAALTHHRAAHDLACGLGQPADQARALYGLALAHCDLGQLRQAREHWQHALNILTGLGLTHAEEVSVDQIHAHLNNLAAPDVRRGGFRR